MKIQFIKIVTTGICALSVVSSSCKKLIEIPTTPTTQIPALAVFADSSNMMSALVGVYNNFGVTASGGTVHSGAITKATGLSGDELIINSLTDDVNGFQVYQNSISPMNAFTTGLWSTAYSSLYQVNACLEGISASNGISASLKKQAIGELKVTRALYYFNLVNLFGGVPLITSTDYKETAVLPRATVEDVYALITADLSDALTKLSPSYPSEGRLRPNLYTAYALLAKVYLYQGLWAKAAEAADIVINSGLYALSPELKMVFIDGSEEAIWQLPANGPNAQTVEASFFVPFYSPVIIPNFYLTPALLGAFESGDQRKLNWLGVNVNRGTSYYYPYKYKNTSRKVGPDEDYMIFRLGEIYLIRSEALAQQGKISQSLEDLNLIRDRAGLEGETAVAQADLLAKIMHERQVELFCEWGNRWYDLKRTKTIDTVLGGEKPGWRAASALYPIPLTQLQSNPFLKQNPGY